MYNVFALGDQSVDDYDNNNNISDDGGVYYYIHTIYAQWTGEAAKVLENRADGKKRLLLVK